MSSAYVFNRRQPVPVQRKKKVAPAFTPVHNVSITSRLNNVLPVSLRHCPTSDTILLSCFVDVNAGQRNVKPFSSGDHGPDLVPKGPYLIRVRLDASWISVSDTVLTFLRNTQKEERHEWLESEGTMLHGTYQGERLTTAKRRQAAIEAGKSIQLRQSMSLRFLSTDNSSIGGANDVAGVSQPAEPNGTRLTPASELYFPGSDTSPLAFSNKAPLYHTSPAVTHSHPQNTRTTNHHQRSTSSNVRSNLGSRSQDSGPTFNSRGQRSAPRSDEEAGSLNPANVATLNSLSGLIDASPCGTAVQDRSLGPVVPSSGSSGDLPKKGTAAQLCLLLHPATPTGQVITVEGDLLRQLSTEAFLGEGTESQASQMENIPFRNVIAHYLAEIKQPTDAINNRSPSRRATSKASPWQEEPVVRTQDLFW